MLVNPVNAPAPGCRWSRPSSSTISSVSLAWLLADLEGLNNASRGLVAVPFLTLGNSVETLSLLLGKSSDPQSNLNLLTPMLGLGLPKIVDGGGSCLAMSEKVVTWYCAVSDRASVIP